MMMNNSSKGIGTRKSQRRTSRSLKALKAPITDDVGMNAKRTKVEPPGGEQFVGIRVAKFFFDDIDEGRSNAELKKFFGTIKRYDDAGGGEDGDEDGDDHESWRIDYDDGDTEDMGRKELLRAIALAEEDEPKPANKVKGRAHNAEKKAKAKKGRFVDEHVAKFVAGRGLLVGQVKRHYRSKANNQSGDCEEYWKVTFDDGEEESMKLNELLECMRKWQEVSKCVVFGHPGIEKNAFEGPKNANTDNIIANPLNLELTMKGGCVWRGKGSVFSTPKGDHRYLMQTKAHVISGGKKGEKVTTKLVRFAAEYAGYAEEIARSKDVPASSLDKPWTRVYEPLLCPNYPVEAIIRDDDPLVLTGGEFRYGLCKQFQLKKMRTLAVGSIIIFCSMNNLECYLDTVFVVGKCVDVVDESEYQEAKRENGEASPLDFCTISSKDFSSGADAWAAAVEQGSEEEGSLVTVEQANTLTALQKDFRTRNPTPRRLAVPPKKGSGPLSGRLYWGRSYDPNNSDVPFSFIPVWEVPKGKEVSTEERHMRPRPKLNFKQLYKKLGCSKVPNYNAQLTSVPVPMDGIEEQKRCFHEILRQVAGQGFEAGVRFSPPRTMSPLLEEKLATLELGEIILCENSFGSSERGIKKGRLVTTEDRKDEIWEVQSLHMGPYIRVKNQATGDVEDWPSIGTKSNIIPARGYS